MFYTLSISRPPPTSSLLSSSRLPSTSGTLAGSGSRRKSGRRRSSHSVRPHSGCLIATRVSRLSRRRLMLAVPTSCSPVVLPRGSGRMASVACCFAPCVARPWAFGHRGLCLMPSRPTFVPTLKSGTSADALRAEALPAVTTRYFSVLPVECRAGRSRGSSIEQKPWGWSSISRRRTPEK